MPGLGLPQPKRVGPPDVKPLMLAGLRFEAVHWGRERGFGQNGGVIAAVDPRSGKEQWTLKVYTIDYLPALETDVQDIFIKTLAKTTNGRDLLVTDERGRRFEIDVAARTVRALP